MNDIFTEITRAFGALWHCRPRGDSLEIATPVPTSTEKYVTVFLTCREGKWIVSDGGMTRSGMYDHILPSDSQTYERIHRFFLDDFGIKRTQSANGTVFYYKSTTCRELVPNIIFDLSNFIAIAVNCSLVDYAERRERTIFTTTVRDFLADGIPQDKVAFNATVNPGLDAKFSAVITTRRGKFSLINFATGANDSYMRRSIANSNIYYDMLEESPFADNVKQKVLLLNDRATGYDRRKLDPFIKVCESKGQKAVEWSSVGPHFLTQLTA